MRHFLNLTCLIIASCLVIALASCAKEDVYRGIYEATTQEQEMKRDSSGPVAKDRSPSYGQYEQDRQEVIGEKTE